MTCRTHLSIALVYLLTAHTLPPEVWLSPSTRRPPASSPPPFPSYRRSFSHCHRPVLEIRPLLGAGGSGIAAWPSRRGGAVARSSPGSCRRRGGPGAGDGRDGGQRNGVKEQGPRWRPARRHEGEGPDGSLCDGAKELAWRARVARAGKGAQGHASRERKEGEDVE
ncbi:hypothetical protein PVAP13_1NG342300 [Panicum virgatum]|uniref:Uncharacterized protein n=1 Tax=Panicum virgatum TaxID=38727 RepID=A0A8T0X4K1_PANVG|nr:hypothetical protein PVAP13_1NG342300 [Panicum virgatum]